MLKIEEMTDKELRMLKRKITNLQQQYVDAGFNERVAYVMSCSHHGYKELCVNEKQEELEYNRTLQEQLDVEKAEWEAAEAERLKEEASV